MKSTSIRTPLGKVRGLGSAKSGTEHWWEMRLTSIALLPLTLAAIVIVISLIGRNHAAVAQILGSPLVAITMLLSSAYLVSSWLLREWSTYKETYPASYVFTHERASED